MPIIDYVDSIVMANDPATRAMVDRIKSKTITLGLITTPENAQAMADRYLKEETYPRVGLNIEANRDMFKYEVGDLFPFTLSEWGWNERVFRIDTITEDNIGNAEKIKIKAIEEVEYTSTKAFYEPGTQIEEGPDVPSIDPLTSWNVIEAPYVLAGDNLRVVPLASKDVASWTGFLVYISTNGGSSYQYSDYVSSWSPHGTLVGSYTDDTYTIDDSVGFRVNFDGDSNEVDKIETITRDRLFTNDNLAMIRDEIISIQTITPVSGTLYDMTGIVRGRYDSEQTTHSGGSDFWYLGNYNYQMIEDPDIQVGADLKFKLVPFDFRATGLLSEATAIDLTIEGRSRKPYRPINLKLNDMVYKPKYTSDVVLNWDPRIKYETPGAGTGIADFITDETVEWDGYFKIETVVSGSIVRTTTAIDAREWTYTSAMNVSDNGALTDDITFSLYNYRTIGGITYTSISTTASVEKE